MKKKVFNLGLFFLTTISVMGQNVIDIAPESAVDESFFEFIPEVDYGGILEQNGTTSFTTEYSPSGSYWLDPTPADEEHVYLAKIEHEASTEENSWQLRIGQGGQIYSFKSAYGEGIPPQSKEKSTWNDEVWQPVSVSLLNNRDFTSRFYFIHGAGAYNYDDIEKTWYSPLMASHYDSQEKAYYVTNWGSQAHIPSLYKSEILYTTKYKEIGEGVLEVTYIIQNFGDETMVHINCPWGGVRASNLRGKFVGLPDGNIEESFGSTAGEVDTRDIDETGGYVIWSENTVDNEAASMGIVFGNELKKDELSSHGLRNVFFRLGQVGGDANPRDYTLFTVISQINIERGESFFYRTYYINGTRDFVQEKSNLLNPYSDYGFIEPVAEETPVVEISEADSEQGLSQGISLFTSYTEEMLPIFLMKNTITGEEYISPDLYYNAVTAPLVNPYEVGHEDYEMFQNREVYRLHKSDIEYVRLLGYAYNKDMSGEENFVLLDDLILDDAKVVLTEEYVNKIWVQKLGEETCTDEMIPRAQIYGELANSDLSIEITEGDSLIFKPQVSEEGVTSAGNGTWTWQDPSAVSHNGRVLTLEPIALTDAGIYSVTYESGGCEVEESFEVIVNQIVTGVSDSELLNSVSIYPNPSSKNFHVKNANGKEIKVYNLFNQLLIITTATSDDFEIDLNDYPKGIYLLQLNGDSINNTHRIIKK